MDIVNVINLDRREDRLLSITRQAKWQGFPIKVWEAIEEPVAYRGICQSHKKIILDAKQRGLKRVTVAEDDAMFTAEGAWQYYLDNMPPVYDIYLSMIYSGEIVDNRILNGWSAMTLYTVHEDFYDRFLEVPDDRHIDRCLGQDAYKNNYLVCPEFVCYQSGGYSDNLKQTLYYDSYLKGKKLFGREILY